MNELDFIQSVKIQGNGYLLNGTMSVPKVDGNREYELIKEWLSEGNTPEPEFTEEELAQQELNKKIQEAKAAKALALSTITVEVNNKVFDGNETARTNILSRLQASQVLNEESIDWKLADNTVAEVTVEELKEVLTKSIQEVGRIVMVTSIEEL